MIAPPGRSPHSRIRAARTLTRTALLLLLLLLLLPLVTAL